MTKMMTSLLATACAASLIGCIKQDDPPEAIKRAIPTADQVAIKLPDSTSRKLDQAEALNQLADWYVATRDVTRTFNVGTAWVLVLIHTIVQFPVTSVDGDTYTWGPSSSALDPAEYKLDVRDVGDGTFEYQLSGRSKIEPTAEFVVIIDGKADPRKGDLQGSGQFLVDFDAGRRVNPIDGDDARGQVDVGYDLAARHLDLTLSSTDDKGAPVTADYAYNETADGGGDMLLALTGDAGGGTAKEQIALRSRWLASGAGRADARIVGGDAASTVTASECWSTQFRRTFFTASLAFAPTEGVETDCSFATADLPPLP